MKHSLFAVFSVLICIVYGQLPVNWNIDPFGYHSYVASASSAQRNLANFAAAVQPDGGEMIEKRSRTKAGSIEFLEFVVEFLAKEFRTGIKATDAKVMDVINKLDETSEFLSQALIDIVNLKQEQEDYAAMTTDKITKLEAKIDAFSCTCDDPMTIGKIPGSCLDLKDVGNTKSGLYSVLGSKQIETVYCDFTIATDGAGFQKSIGYQNIKSKPTYFYVQKTQHMFASTNTMPFERTILNIGQAMNLGNGVFTAPVTGTYFFSFSGLVQFPPTSSTDNYLYLTVNHNGKKTATGQLNEMNAVPNPYFLRPLTVQCTLMLQAGDAVWLEVGTNGIGYLFDENDTRYTHYNGWLLEEEITTPSF